MSLLSGRVCKVLSLYHLIGTYLMMVSAAGVNLLVVGSEGSKVGPAREQVTHAEKITIILNVGQEAQVVEIVYFISNKANIISIVIQEQAQKKMKQYLILSLVTGH